MAPRIVWLGAVAGVCAIFGVFVVFLLPLPPILAIPLYLLFGGVFVAGAAIFGRLLVIE